MKTALILGVTGQTGSYLAELLLSKGYAVHGVIRRASSFNTGRIDHIFDRLTLHYGDVLDPLSIRQALTAAQPDEVYNLAAQSHVKVSFDQPCYSFQTAADGALNVLEAIRDFSAVKPVRYYQASSSEMFGNSPPPQNEATPFDPRSPYACAKVAAYNLTRLYREAYGLFACNGILFNHESPRRGETFVTRKITRAVGRIKYGLQEKLVLGNLDAQRDWGFAGDYVEAIHALMQQPTAQDIVIGTGETNSVRDWCQWSFALVGMDWQDFVETDARYLRPAEVVCLRANASRARRCLGWTPHHDARSLCDMMVNHDLGEAEAEAWAKQRPTSVALAS